MGPIAKAAQSASVLVCVGGHDPSNQIHRSQPFYASEGDTTTISTSGLIFSHDTQSQKAYVLVLKTALQPFVSNASEHFDSPEALRGDEAAPSLMRPDAFLRVLCTAQTDKGKSVVSWRSARALHVIQLSGVREALQRLVKAQESGAWRIGWAVEGTGGLLRLPVEAQIQHAGTLVVLEVDCGDDTFQLTETASLQGAKLEPGSQVVSSGSPFGLLAPRHFAHSLTWGHVSNLWPSVDGFGNSLLMLDIRVLPGMEGGPVLDERGALIGLLLPPLLNTSTRTEIPLAISFEELLRSLRTFFAANTAQSDFWRSLKMWTRSTAGRRQARLGDHV
ncbi:hypothetical protein CYMTET_3701 [Cymbomonas tetramitiformis]|uniref:Uncharacterized protein n=1 Tax=Cymbomonas tetramitiformis TaxID=36881 RepID=A0AAE0H2U2_9CHLO|nr:hypothetical protein CYMTET_3701 [Cymbomonas tetramitiformis]